MQVSAENATSFIAKLIFASSQINILYRNYNERFSHMFSLFKKSPIDKLKKQHAKLLEEAMQAQRRGDIRSYSELSDKAQAILDQIDSLEAQ